jgi:putative oxidoreductase
MTPKRIVAASGRGLLALLFVLAGIAKILTPQPFLQHMAQFDLPGVLLPAVIAFELGAGLMLLSGWKLAYSAGALAIFCLLTATIFHHQLSIAPERTQFLKDLALAGALAVIAAGARSAPPPAAGDDL